MFGKIPNHRILAITRIFPWLMFLFLCGCTSVPPQVATTHQREKDIVESLQDSHLKMVDAYVDQKIQIFENFFFQEYGPVFRAQWVEGFEEINGRAFDQERDFPSLYSDLVAVYQVEVAPIEDVRTELRNAIATEYRNAIMAHDAVGRWLNSLDDLNSSQREAFEGLLGRIKPGLSLDVVDEAVSGAISKSSSKLEGLGEE